MGKHDLLTKWIVKKMLVHFFHEFNLFLPLKYGIQIDVKMQLFNDL